MRVLVDTSVWSSALRRAQPAESAEARELRNLVLEHRVEIIGPIRQEILSGVRSEPQFEKLAKRLEPFPDVPLSTRDHVEAARYFNICRARGVQGSNTDFLICAVAVRHDFCIFTTDGDFARFARHLPITLHRTRD